MLPQNLVVFDNEKMPMIPVEGGGEFTHSVMVKLCIFLIAVLDELNTYPFNAPWKACPLKPPVKLVLTPVPAVFEMLSK